MRHWFAPVLVSLIACSKGSTVGSTPTNGTAAPTVAVAASATQPTPSAAPTPSATIPAPATPSVGTATLVLQKVYSDCGDGQTPHLLGTDVLVLLRGEDAKAKPTKEYAFCPSHGADGGATKPQLQMWENCRSFPACQIVSADAATPTVLGHVEVQCGKEHIELESDGTHTVIRGSFGVREIAPHPTTVAPVKSEVRHAFVDC
jgi:hypothetical protein